jgi:pimeloyl-ACP methyl ester carboxylesterase
MGYIDLRGHQLWSNEFPNNGEPLLSLHGGLSASHRWDWTILPAVEHDHHLYSYDRTAHGRTGIRPGFYHFDFQTEEAIAYIEDVIKEPTHMIGHSDGAIISLMVAIKRPDLVKSIVSIGGNYHWDAGFASDEFDGEIMISEEDAAEFAELSPDDPSAQQGIIQKAMDVWKSEPNLTKIDLAKIHCPVLVMAGEVEPFSNHHTIDLYESLADADLAIVPGATHSVMKDKPELALAIIKDFYGGISARSLNQE